MAWELEMAALKARVKQMKEALMECEEYFDARADADQPEGYARPIPNQEMEMLVIVRAAMKDQEAPCK